ncbi:unnamed protein product [Durusdinium trenchii]|uniref:Uncharacterized protein n=1 Tax=Durusdinium trenchii TaxID=1381693 RepID=A0ABP0NEV9_9DINO
MYHPWVESSRKTSSILRSEPLGLGSKAALRLQALFPHVHEHVKPNLGNTERWVPYHTVLGVHELFLMEAGGALNKPARGMALAQRLKCCEAVHSRTDWTEKQKFLAIFVFRAHCKRDLFSQAQVPLMKKEFWKNPVKAFEPEGRMEKAILSYRKKTGNPLLTNCFRIIPERVLKDNDANLVRSIVTRLTTRLSVHPNHRSTVQNKKLSAKDKLADISEMIQSTEGCGDTWAKMLTVCIDLAYPKEKILDADCDVGVGAAPPLQCLLGNAKLPDRRSALRELLGKVNKSQSASAKHFWKYLTEVETSMRQKFRHLPLVSRSAPRVQLCEYRQFRHTWARNVYGLPDDAHLDTEVMKDSFWVPSFS